MPRPPSARAQLLDSYSRLQSAVAKRDELLPDRLKTMKADPEWIEAVFEKNQAFKAFVLAALSACDSWSSDPNFQTLHNRATYEVDIYLRD
jgi:hypothetical protein